MKSVALVNLLQGADREAALMVEAANLYTQELLRLTHDEPRLYVLAPDPTLPPEQIVADELAILAAHSDDAGAAGYHFLDDDGRPTLKAFLDGTESGALLRDPKGNGDSVVEILLHEVAENSGDTTADFYVAEPWTGPDGVTWTLRAFERSDPFQGQSRLLTLKDGTQVDAPDFATDDYFNSRAKKGAVLDWMGICTTPGELAAGGYQIAARITAEKDVFADCVMHRGGGPHAKAMAAKRRPTARTAKRIAQIVKMLRTT